MTAATAPSIEAFAGRQRPGYSLEQPFYTDPAIFERDMQRIVSHQWLFVDHVARLPTPGSYLVYRIAGESIVLVKGRDGQVRAFFNVCRHRGSLICLEDAGSTRTLTCPYHGWVYDLEGRLIHAKNMPADFDAAAWPLHPCQVRVFEGLVFINLGREDDPATMPFDPLADALGRYLRPNRLDKAKIVARKTYPTHGNWKLAVENFRECYHCAPAHPEYTMVNAYVKAGDDNPGSYQAVTRAWADAWAAKGHVVGNLDSTTTDRRQPYGVFRQPIREGWQTLSQDGRAVAPLMGDLKAFDCGETLVIWGPLFYVYLANDHATLFRFTPVSPTITDVVLIWLVREDAVEGRDYNVDRITWMWDVTTIQDTTIIGDNQTGVNSRRYVPGPYATLEMGTRGFVDWYVSRIA
ncbi:MAG: aromatic ring-hydroxylating dioxygenase subunit alpha [Alphaproteobacteria bacterium]|nr:aromatic ring-hydroxylating dioxygenase subunit alpha [Alphaproteobacteria bacterium]